MLGLSQPRMHVSCLHSHFGTRWSQTRNVSLMIIIKPKCLRAYGSSEIFQLTVTYDVRDTHLCVFIWKFNMHKHIHIRETVNAGAHAFKLRGLGVHIKLIKSVVEIIVCCSPGTSVQWLGRHLIFSWQAGGGWMRVEQLLFIKWLSRSPPHWHPNQRKPLNNNI